MSFTFTTPVRFADVDHAGIVYYPRFFHLFHLAFEELWRARIGPRAYSELIDRDRVGFPAVRAECDFKAPLRFGDSADIEVSIARLGGKSITFRYRVFRVDHLVARALTAPPDPSLHSASTASLLDPRELAAEGLVICAVVDLARVVAVPVPERVVAMLADLVET